MRSIGLDVHRDLCEVAMLGSCGGRARGRVATTPEDLQLFAGSLGPDDRVVLEVTGNAWEIARVLEPHVARVIVVSPSDTGIRQARAKTDRLDALALAKLMAAGSLDAVWVPDQRNKPGIWGANKQFAQAERDLAQQAELAYKNTVRDWTATRPAKVGASATPGRASQRPSRGKAARQTP